MGLSILGRAEKAALLHGSSLGGGMTDIRLLLSLQTAGPRSRRGFIHLPTQPSLRCRQRDLGFPLHTPQVPASPAVHTFRETGSLTRATRLLSHGQGDLGEGQDIHIGTGLCSCSRGALLRELGHILIPFGILKLLQVGHRWEIRTQRVMGGRL